MEPLIYRINIGTRPETRAGTLKGKVDGAFLLKRGFSGDYNGIRNKRRGKKDFPEDRFMGRAVSIFTEDVMRILRGRGFPVHPGDFGENLSVRGIDYDQIRIGDRFSLGEGGAAIEITEPTNPCKNLLELYYFQNANLKKLKSFLTREEGRRGWYARVLQEGQVNTGDSFRRYSWK